MLDNTYEVVADEDTLTKELYNIKQGPKESVNHFDTHIGYAMMRLAAVFQLQYLSRGWRKLRNLDSWGL